VLNSVHAFANDPRRGFFILIILFFAITLPLLLFAWRAPKLNPGAPFDVASRETGIMINNLLLTASAAITLTGTLYPLVLDAAEGIKISVGPPYYNATVVPLFVVLAVRCCLVRSLWRRAICAAPIFHCALPELPVLSSRSQSLLSPAIPRPVLA
jgi:cytochrome c-type biogenesis protein CcmF